MRTRNVNRSPPKFVIEIQHDVVGKHFMNASDSRRVAWLACFYKCPRPSRLFGEGLNIDIPEFSRIHGAVGVFGRQCDVPKIANAESLQLAFKGRRYLFFSLDVNEGACPHVRRDDRAIVEAQRVLDRYSISVLDHDGLSFTPNSTNPLVLEFRDLRRRSRKIKTGQAGNFRTSRFVAASGPLARPYATRR
jgi:hypothetical protein